MYNIFRNQDIWVYVSRLLVVFLVLPIHEAAHAWAAYKLGDPTAKQLGRMTLNPIKHIDPTGLVTMLLFGFGWEKPVPVNSRYFKNPKRDNALVAVAGPLSNFLMAFVLFIIEGVLIRFSPNVLLMNSRVFLYFLLIIDYMAYISIFLGVFNLIPVPPLDGFNVLGGFIPTDVYNRIYQYARYGMAIVFILMWVGILSVPVSFLTNGIEWIFQTFLQLLGLRFIF